MEIKLHNVGKKFSRNWIFQHLSTEIKSGSKWVILGPNGSGKSTLLQIISGMTLPSEGNVQFFLDGNEIQGEEVYKFVNISAPYANVLEPLTLSEMLKVHRKFRNPIDDLNDIELAEEMKLSEHFHKKIVHFSSGMKQRLRLALALMFESSLVLLDEPTSNLDENGRRWYREKCEKYLSNRTVVVGSNHQEEEYFFATERFELTKNQ